MSAVVLGPPEKPMKITLLARIHSSITVGWTAGLNGGSEQQFKVLYKQKGKENWNERKDSISGLRAGESMNYTINGLDAMKDYEITVVSISRFQGRSESRADIQTYVANICKLKISLYFAAVMCHFIKCAHMTWTEK